MNDPWERLRRLTPARIALGAAGHAQPTRAHLDFCEAHAAARDAVQARFNSAAFCLALSTPNANVIELESRAPTRDVFLRRPDLGRSLTEASANKLKQERCPGETSVVVVVSDGLSALAVERHGLGLVSQLVAGLNAEQLGPVCVTVVPLSRVAIGDEVGGALQAKLSVVIVGERPGLSSVDSLGAYLTFEPRAGRTDAERNCVSNIREPGGLPLALAVSRIVYLAREAIQRQLSGVNLKDESSALGPGPLESGQLRD
jgi:ethanolamine ammonia-lyase small subunit